MPAGFSASDFYYLLPEFILAAAAMLVLVVDALIPREKSATVLAGVSLAGVVGTLVALIPSAQDVYLRSLQITIARGMVAIDGFSLFFQTLFLVAAAITVLMSARYLQVEGARAGAFYFLVLCATLGMMFMAAGSDLVTIFIGLETMAVSFYVLAGFLKPSRRSNEAAVKYFLLGTFSLGLLLYGMSMLYGLSGTTNLHDIATAVAAHGRSRWIVLAVILVAAGVGFKIAAVPFHMWAPDVYEGAPTPITAFLSVGSKAASFAMVLRIFVQGLPSLNADWRLLFYALAVMTMTVGNVAALTQSNIKRMLAYSSIAHAGYLMIGLVVGTGRGITAMLVYLFLYAFMQLGAFVVISMLRRADTIGDELKDLSGLFSRSPVAAMAMLVFMLSLGGIPPTAGFMGKFYLFGAAIEAGYVWLAVIGVLNSAVSLYYYFRVIVFMWIKTETIGSRTVLSPALSAALAIALVGTLFFGVYPRALFDFADASARTLGVLTMTASVR